MEVSYSPIAHNKIDYYPLPNGYADVFLHRNMRMEEDKEGVAQYVADEVYFQVNQSVTKEMIEENFDYMWNDAMKVRVEPTIEERVKALETLELERILGGV